MSATTTGLEHDGPADGGLLAAASRLHGRVLTLGDLMLDIFAYGTIARISPEAPVPVLNLARETRMLGGVGNVSRNIAALNGRSLLVSAVGADAAGGTVEALLAEEERIDHRIVRCIDRPTTTKRRFIASAQQVLRVDHEESAPVDATAEDALIAAVRDALPEVSAVVVSDYGKGVLTPRVLRAVIEAARTAGRPVVVDPKHRDVGRYAGATCITPNVAELALATGMPAASDDAVVAAARVMLEAARADYVLVTRSEKGMSLVGREATPLHIPARKREVYDVSGAGDTVIGTLALAVASGIPWPAAAELANYAAGVAVAKQGTATCSLDELELEIADTLLGFGTKLHTASQAGRLAAQWRRTGQRVGFTNGCFDLLHPGHISLLRQSRAACDRLIVGLNSDASVQRLKGPTRPLQSEVARAAVLAALGSVDLVVIFDEDTPLNLIDAVRPSVLLKGADYTLDQVVGADVVMAYGGEVKLVDLVQGQSTTSIISRMNA